MEFRTLREKLQFSHDKYQVMKQMEDLFVEKGYLYLEPDPFDDYQKYISNGGEDEGQYVKMIAPSGDVKLLKADLTTGLVEDIYMEEVPSLLKVFYNEDVYRNKKNRTEIFTKVGVEVFGKESMDVDREILSMAMEILSSYHSEPMLEIGLGPVVHHYLEKENLSGEEKKKILGFLRHMDRPHLKDYLEEKGLWEDGSIFYDLLSWHGSWDEVQEPLSQLEKEMELSSVLQYLKGLDSFFKERGKVNIRYDFGAIPDFHYYSSFSFRGFFPDWNEVLLKGGRYQLHNREGKVVPGVGFSVELTSLMNYLGGKR